MRNKSLFGIGMIALLIVLASASATAFGVRPAQQTIDFTPDMTYDGQFTITTNPAEAGDAILSAEGDLAKYVHFKNKHVKLEEQTAVQYTLKLPKSLPPGEHVAKIIIEEDIESPGEGITAKIRLTYKVFVKVPIPEKHIIATLDISRADNLLGITATVKNDGTLPVSSVTPQVSISSQFEKLTTVDFEAQSLGTAQSTTFTKDVNVGTLKRGIYTATASIAYDEGELLLSKQFSVGTALISIARKDTTFKAGTTNKFTFDAQSEWNEPLNNVLANIEVWKDGEKRLSFSAASFDLDTRERKTITADLDATTLEEGTYETKITFIYKDGTAEESFPIEILGSSLEGASGKGISIAGLIAIITINAVIVLYIVHKIMQRKPPQSPLQGFVQKARAAGFTDSNIRERLTKSGWDRSSIDSALER